MSQDIYSKMTVTGNAEILRDFVDYFENTHDSRNVYAAIHEPTEVTHEYLNDNCYCVEGTANYFIINALTLSRKFPSLKFENVADPREDFWSFSICINGKQVDYAEVNSFWPYALDEVKCKLCNASSEFSDFDNEEICSECANFRYVGIFTVFESGQMTENEFLDFF